jgi:hypothetical protein
MGIFSREPEAPVPQTIGPVRFLRFCADAEVAVQSRPDGGAKWWDHKNAQMEKAEEN